MATASKAPAVREETSSEEDRRIDQLREEFEDKLKEVVEKMQREKEVQINNVRIQVEGWSDFINFYCLNDKHTMFAFTSIYKNR